MRIGELAAKAGVSVRALRYYEEQGLLAATRTSSGQRTYPDTAVDRVLLVQHDRRGQPVDPGEIERYEVSGDEALHRVFVVPGELVAGLGFEAHR